MTPRGAQVPGPKRCRDSRVTARVPSGTSTSTITLVELRKIAVITVCESDARARSHDNSGLRDAKASNANHRTDEPSFFIAASSSHFSDSREHTRFNTFRNRVSSSFTFALLRLFVGPPLAPEQFLEFVPIEPLSKRFLSAESR